MQRNERCLPKRVTSRSTQLRVVDHTINRSKKPKIKKRTGRFPVFPGAVLGVILLLYLLAGLKYRNAFLPHTTIGGIWISGMTVEEAQAEIEKVAGRYELILEERNGIEEHISGTDIKLRADCREDLRRGLENQNSLLWGLRLLGGEEALPDYKVTFDKDRLKAAVLALDCLNPELVTEPADASLRYGEGGEIQVVPEAWGNLLDSERLIEEIESAVLQLKNRISLEQLDLYQKPKVQKDSPELMARMDAWKAYAGMTVTYRFGNRTEVLDGETICQWLSDGDGTVTFDRGQIEAYVKGLAETYNTAYCAKKFKTSYGPTVTISAGHYGWMLDQQKETDALLEILHSGKSQEREPAYLQTAASRDGPDYGDTYVEINLTAQHLYYYKKGELLIESDFVSGDEEKGYSTPAGAYELTYKERNAVLKGKNYNTPVSYWMPFNKNIGMHDGYWRDNFGGTIYKTQGSHGCINLPPAAAKTIYENIEAGTPVLCYHLNGTETKQETD